MFLFKKYKFNSVEHHEYPDRRTSDVVRNECDIHV